MFSASAARSQSVMLSPAKSSRVVAMREMAISGVLPTAAVGSHRNFGGHDRELRRAGGIDRADAIGRGGGAYPRSDAKTAGTVNTGIDVADHPRFQNFTVP